VSSRYVRLTWQRSYIKSLALAAPQPTVPSGYHHDSMRLNREIESAKMRRALPHPRACRTLREAAGVSQAAIAAAVGVSRVTVTRWENGSRSPAPRHLTSYLRVVNDLALELVSEKRPR
jgi:DNA-binding transcriptional regulator YiaG